ncbi:MAG: S8 family serine peptidase [Ilumatobacteraceae bacterium]
MRRVPRSLLAALLGVPFVLAPASDAAHADPGLDNVLVTFAGTQTNGPGLYTDPNNKVPNYAVPWGLDILDSRTAAQDDSFTWSNDGTGVNVYVLDSGVQADHPDFGGRVSSLGWSYRANSDTLTSYKNSRNANVIPACASAPAMQQFDPATYDSPASAVTGDTGTVDNNGHGTHVAGLVGGSLTGVAKNVTIIPVRALDSCGNGNGTMLLEALKWINSDHGTGEKAVLNMSIGLADNNSASVNNLKAEIALLLAEGVVIVAAAGNSAGSACGLVPAGTPGTISVGAVGHDMLESRFSNYGECVDLFAPGGQVEADGVSAYLGRQILSTWPKKTENGQVSTLTYYEELGTSMAAPHVTGAVATWLQGQSASATNDEDAWAWLKRNATFGLVSYVRTSGTQTPNRLVSLAAPSAPCAPTNVTVTQATGQSTVSWDEVPSGNGSDITGYQVSTVPASAGCTTNASTFSCTLTGLTDGTAYSVSVKAVNGIGPGTAATKALISGPTGTLTPTTTVVTTTTVAPTTTTTVPEPVAPATADTSTSKATSITISWPATAPVGEVTYVVTISGSGVTCTTTGTSCTFAGVKTGTNYTFLISVRNASGAVSGSSLKVTAVAGFTHSVKSVKVNSRTLLTRIVKTVSKGKRTYRVTSGKCRISTGRLVAPATVGTCRVKVSVARSGSYRAFSTSISVAVTK